MPDIDPTNIESVNSIQTKYKEYRQNSKQYTFGLQYGIEPNGITRNTGTPIEDATRIYNNYHNAYKVSLQWKKDKLKQASIDGYVITGLGLKVRTPLLKQYGYDAINTNHMVAAEARTAGNALGQGWGVLNDRARTAVMEQVDELGLSLYILPIAAIHDANYFLVKNDIDILLTLNRLVVKEAKWNNHPDIYHEDVGLEGQLDVFYPDWASPLTLPEDCSEEQLLTLVQQHKEKLCI